MRRYALLLIVLLVLTWLAVACAQPTPAVRVEEKIVQETVVVEKEVEKVVEKVVEVEKEVIVTATPVPAEEKVTFHGNLGTEPPTADPSLATDTTSVAVIESMFLGLTDLDDETVEAIPGLATEWFPNADSTVWTFKMRDDVPWVRYNPGTGQVEAVTDDKGNVRIVNAHDVVYGVKRTCDPNTGSDYAYVLYIVAGCEELNTADPKAEEFQAIYDAVGVRAVDDSTVEFTLTYGAGFFPQIASMWIAYPMPQWIIDQKGDRWIEPGFINTNGPYVMTEWVHGDHMVREKNPFWPGWKEFADEAGNVERIDDVMIEEASTEFALYESNELDLSGVPLDQIERVQADPQLSQEYVNYPENCTYYYGFTTQKPPTDDVRVRKALSMAIDRQTLVETVTKGGQIPANVFTNPLNFGSPAYNTDIAPWALPKDMGGWGYDDAVAEGKKLLEEAGHPDGAGLNILLMHNVSEGHARIAQAIQAMWHAAYPQMNVTIETQEWRVYLKTIDRDSPLEDKPNVWRLGWCADYPHANNWIHEVFHPTQGANEPLISPDDPQVGDAVARFADLTQEAQVEPDPARQAEMYKEAERLFIDEIVGIAPIYFYVQVAVAKPWLDRVWSNAGRQHIWKWKIDWEAKQAARGK